MKIINRARGGGKTTEAIKESNRTWKYILVLNYDRARQVAKLSKDLDIDIPFPITVEELKRDYLAGSNVEGLIIDELDDVLYALTRHHVTMATLTEK
jgi:predicted HAD superfamily phosphohydrolase YqeG